MKKVLVPQFAAAAIALAALLPQQSSAAVPPVDGTGRAAFAGCPASTLTVPAIYHFDKIIFSISATPPLVAVNPADQPALNALPRNLPLDIKVLDNPRTIAHLKAKVLSFLGATVTPNSFPAVNIIEVEYATAVCNPKGW
jgi:hypothetical protein